MSNKKILRKGVCVLFVFIFMANYAIQAQYNYQEEPLLQIINNIEQQTSYRFLYRDALIADITLSIENSDNIFSDLQTALLAKGIQLKVDRQRKQAIIYQQNDNSSHKVSIRGQVVDAQTGERLPYATITWKQNGQTKGTSTNESGSFTIDRTFLSESVDISCSYIGYNSNKITLDFSESNNIQNLTFRLNPERIDGNQLVVTGSNYYSNLNKQASNLVDIGTFSVFGETNSLRALQTLPSVSPSTAVSDGLNVRGSPSDGFRVLVDGITIYNQSHLFGLVDSFNGDILQRSGFFYDIAPANVQAPPGGTLSLLTKTGSLKEFSGSAGLSNSSARLTLEGPIKKGRSSWLISGRKSYLNTIDWLNNSELISHGLNVDRDHSILNDGLIDLQSRLVRPGKTDASFFDLHGKLYFENKNGNRLIITGYFGGDNTRQNAERLFRNFSTSVGNTFAYESVAAENDWQNGAATIQYQQWFNDNLYSTSTLGTSIYSTSFLKDDFTYTRVTPATQSLQSFVYLFENKSVLNQFKAEQQLELNANPWLLTGGVSYNYYLSEYYENSFDRPGYFTSRESHKLDTYLQLDFTGWDPIDIFGGTRAHYFSNGQYLKWSPRIKFNLFPDSRLSFSGGFSRNYQFLNQIKISNTVTSDVWILSGENQKPTSVNYFSAGSYFDISNHFYAQVETYYKRFENLRLHEVNTFSLSNTFNTNPFYSDNQGEAKGIEFLLRSQWSVFTLSQTFTISEMVISNPSINNGEPFYADWDRTYRYNATLATQPLPNFSLYLSWIYASGRPNKLATFGPQNNDRLNKYQRTDISAEYKRKFESLQLMISASVFNVMDRQNPWYRKLNIAVDKNTTPSQFRRASVDVYDIGFQPSINIRVKF
ncbi:TonB-dependent Receptor Plug Domain [Fodinibius salinus]|uniref:TonB-dependent Receptor Plug Domain n=1 Tax=Fodinibius salinus TaxID=860790 RepID=A0A5D3YHQ3_9BACT|nr:TonB-dependent receptor [Fodinibius salinus]TYP92797.1 TonB-dependent Receptor Plug Domain [Fodinibius salinus]